MPGESGPPAAATTANGDQPDRPGAPRAGPTDHPALRKAIGARSYPRHARPLYGPKKTRLRTHTPTARLQAANGGAQE